MPIPPWPGADGLTLEEVLAGSPPPLAAGLVPGPKDLLERHSDLAEEIRAFFGSGV